MKRNRIKRLIKECFRLNQHKIPLKADIVVVCKRGTDADNLDQNQVNQEIMELLNRIGSSLTPGSKESETVQR